eukprot:10089016-Alexandrium_andersonii.AAC.1
MAQSPSTHVRGESQDGHTAANLIRRTSCFVAHSSEDGPWPSGHNDGRDTNFANDSTSGRGKHHYR